ncbi:hypothetical protein KIL84_011174 [Mauremys mutica]|uniref:Uncharacterized protein n=1 Tax=Mauremys mutica TaxID=74926 RepID=A0A9D3XCJ5_9SAUR|nr:hypothetical protein KIL84_011174 [Mauremys mutica]
MSQSAGHKHMVDSTQILYRNSTAVFEPIKSCLPSLLMPFSIQIAVLLLSSVRRGVESFETDVAVLHSLLSKKTAIKNLLSFHLKLIIQDLTILNSPSYGAWFFKLRL